MHAKCTSSTLFGYIFIQKGIQNEHSIMLKSTNHSVMNQSQFIMSISGCHFFFVQLLANILVLWFSRSIWMKLVNCNIHKMCKIFRKSSRALSKQSPQEVSSAEYFGSMKAYVSMMLCRNFMTFRRIVAEADWNIVSFLNLLKNRILCIVIIESMWGDGWIKYKQVKQISFH